jgi:hypothetical protein
MNVIDIESDFVIESWSALVFILMIRQWILLLIRSAVL